MNTLYLAICVAVPFTTLLGFYSLARWYRKELEIDNAFQRDRVKIERSVTKLEQTLRWLGFRTQKTVAESESSDGGRVPVAFVAWRYPPEVGDA